MGGATMTSLTNNPTPRPESWTAPQTSPRNDSRARPPTAADPDAWTRPTHNGYRQTGLILLITLAILSAPLSGAGWMVYEGVTTRRAAKFAATQERTAHERLLAAPPSEPLPTSALVHGRQLFMSACAACHGPSGAGVDG